MRAKVLVMLSTYNGEPYLIDQLKSIVNQNNVDFFLLIRDDGSSDDSVVILKQFCEEYSEMTELILGVNVGFARSFWELASISLEKYTDYDYFAFSDQDDCWLPDKLFNAVNFLTPYSKGEKYPLLYCSNLLISDQYLHPLRKKWGSIEFSKRTCFFYNAATGCTCVFNNVALVEFVKTFTLSYVYHDYWIYLICLFTGKVLYDPNAFILFRRHESNITKHDTFGMMSFVKNCIQSIYKPSIHLESNLAKGLLSYYNEIVDGFDRANLKTFAFYRDSISYKIRLLFKKSLMPARYPFKELLIFKVRVLFNRI